jgi:predicted esterase
MSLRSRIALATLLCAPFTLATDTGFLNRELRVGDHVERYVVYVPREWRPQTARLWPVILYLHGYGESGDDGLAPIANGLASAVAVHPERFPFVVVFPQNPWKHTWLEKTQADAAMAVLDAATREFAGDTNRTYLTGFSMGGFGTWYLASHHPGRFAAIAPLSGGIRAPWTPPETQKPDAYDGVARALGRTPVWISHGDADGTVSVDEARAMYEALQRAGGRVRYSEYQDVGHSAVPMLLRADFPTWLLEHRLNEVPTLPAQATRERVPSLPEPVPLAASGLEAYVGRYEYVMSAGAGPFWLNVAREGDALLVQGADWSSAAVLRPVGPETFRCEWEEFLEIVFERSAAGAVTGLRFRDDRHVEHYTRAAPSAN